jgi:hypothetical protein
VLKQGMAVIVFIGTSIREKEFKEVVPWGLNTSPNFSMLNL